MARSNYRFSFILAITLHVLVFIGLFVHFVLAPTQPSGAAVPVTNVIKAVAVDQAQLSAQQEQKQLAEQQRQEEQKQQLLAQQQAEKLRQQEQITLREKQQAQQQVQQQSRQQATERKRLVAEEIKKELAQQQKQAQQQAQKKQLEVAKKATQQLIQQELANSKATPQKTSAGTRAEQSAIDKYKALIIQAISQQWILPQDVQTNQHGKILVRVAPGGMVLSVRITQSSGDTALDRSARVAIMKASPLPVPSDPVLFNKFRELSFTVQPEGISSG